MKLILKITLLLLTISLTQVISIRLKARGAQPDFSPATQFELDLIDPFFKHEKNVTYKHKVLGNGAYGIAYLVTLTKMKYTTTKRKDEHGREVYYHNTEVNELDKYVVKKASRKHGQREKDIMKIITECNIGVVKLLDFKYSDNINFFKLEFCEGGDLQQRLNQPSPYKQNGIPDREDERSLAHNFLPAIRGLMCLHDNGIIHRDLKPDNIFVCNGQFKIADYGLSTPPQLKFIGKNQNNANVFHKRRNSLFSNNGNPNYHQDMFSDDNYSYSVDVYAMHATFIEVHTKFNFASKRSLNALFYGRADFGYISSNLIKLNKCIFKESSAGIMHATDYYYYMERLSQGKRIDCV